MNDVYLGVENEISEGSSGGLSARTVRAKEELRPDGLLADFFCAAIFHKTNRGIGLNFHERLEFCANPIRIHSDDDVEIVLCLCDLFHFPSVLEVALVEDIAILLVSFAPSLLQVTSKYKKWMLIHLTVIKNVVIVVPDNSS